MRTFRMEILTYNHFNNEHLLYIHECLAIILVIVLYYYVIKGADVFLGEYL